MPLYDDLAVPLDPQELRRRRALGMIGAGALAVAGGGTVVTAVRYLEPAVLYERDQRFMIGRPEEIAVGTVLVLPAQRVYVVRTARGVYALSAVCTHLGCMTRHDRTARSFACPCHGSRFDVTGKVTAGPAPAPLRRLLVSLERGLLWVDAAKTVDANVILEVPA